MTLIPDALIFSSTLASKAVWNALGLQNTSNSSRSPPASPPPDAPSPPPLYRYSIDGHRLGRVAFCFSANVCSSRAMAPFKSAAASLENGNEMDVSPTFSDSCGPAQLHHHRYDKATDTMNNNKTAHRAPLLPRLGTSAARDLIYMSHSMYDMSPETSREVPPMDGATTS